MRTGLQKLCNVRSHVEEHIVQNLIFSGILNADYVKHGKVCEIDVTAVTRLLFQKQVDSLECVRNFVVSCVVENSDLFLHLAGEIVEVDGSFSVHSLGI